jgi:hypothetical protein
MPYYFVHTNKPNRKVVIHLSTCSFCNNGNGVQKKIHGDSNSKWYPQDGTGYSTLEEALTVAQKSARQLNAISQCCKVCI